MNSLPKIAIVALSLALLASCGKATTTTKSDDKSSTSTSASSSPSAVNSSTAEPATGPEMSGTGYSYHLPQGWEDISAELKKRQPGIDSGGRSAKKTPPFTANLNTITTPSQISGEPTQSDLDKLATQLKSEVAAMAPTITTMEQTSLDGAPAVHQEGPATSSGTKFYLVQYFAVHKGANYGLTFAFPLSIAGPSREKLIQPVLASWKWS